MYRHTEIYLGNISAYKKSMKQSDFLIQDIYYDIKDFFDTSFDSKFYRERSLDGNLTRDSMLEEDIDEYDKHTGGIALNAYSDRADFKGLVVELQRRIKLRGKDYAKEIDGVLFNFSGTHTNFLFGYPIIMNVSYDIEIHYHEEDVCKVKLEVMDSNKVEADAQHLRLAANIYAGDTYTPEGIYFFWRMITNAVNGDFDYCENANVVILTNQVKEFLEGSGCTGDELYDAVSEKSLERLFYTNAKEVITIGVEEALELFLYLKEPMKRNLMESGMIG